MWPLILLGIGIFAAVFGLVRELQRPAPPPYAEVHDEPTKAARREPATVR